MRVDDLLPASPAPVGGHVARRTLGFNGTRISGVVNDEVLGYVEVDTNLDSGPGDDATDFLAGLGFRVLTETVRVWELPR